MTPHPPSGILYPTPLPWDDCQMKMDVGTSNRDVNVLLGNVQTDKIAGGRIIRNRDSSRRGLAGCFHLHFVYVCYFRTFLCSIYLSCNKGMGNISRLVIVMVDITFSTRTEHSLEQQHFKWVVERWESKMLS